jgi:hypothetical protein
MTPSTGDVAGAGHVALAYGPPMDDDAKTVPTLTTLLLMVCEPGRPMPAPVAEAELELRTAA